MHNHISMCFQIEYFFSSVNVPESHNTLSSAGYYERYRGIGVLATCNEISTS